jgi:hypothetical protein
VDRTRWVHLNPTIRRARSQRQIRLSQKVANTTPVSYRRRARAGRKPIFGSGASEKLLATFDKLFCSSDIEDVVGAIELCGEGSMEEGLWA